eukprot:m.785113 g.785113  ORF g.785113 m.785113 type:complete len:505 (-) comp23301_c0_seq14:2729-4243(-)
MTDVPSIRRARLREKYGLGSAPSGATRLNAEEKKMALKDALAQVSNTSDEHAHPVCVPQARPADPEAIAEVLKNIDESTTQFLKVVLLLDRMTSVPECVLLGQVIAQHLFDEEKKESNSSEDADIDVEHSTLVDSKTTNALFLKLVSDCAVKQLGLLSVAEGIPFLDCSYDDHVNSAPEHLHFSSRLPMMETWMCVPHEHCLYDINNAVASEIHLQLSSDATSSDSAPSTDIQPLWNAVDGLYAVCCMWTLEGMQSASQPVQYQMRLMAQHMEAILRQLWPNANMQAQAQYDAPNDLYQQELSVVAYTLANMSTLFLQSAGKAKLWTIRALRLHDSIDTTAASPAELHSRMRRRAELLYFLGNVFYTLQDLDESLEHHVSSLDLRKKIDTERDGGPTASGATASSHHQIGNIYASRAQWSRAVKHYTLASQIKDACDAPPASVALTAGCLSRALEQRRDYKGALAQTMKQMDQLRIVHEKNLKDASISECLKRVMHLRKVMKNV